MMEAQALVVGREAWDVMRVLLLPVMVLALLLFLMMALARALAEVEMALVMIVFGDDGAWGGLGVFGGCDEMVCVVELRGEYGGWSVVT